LPSTANQLLSAQGYSLDKLEPHKKKSVLEIFPIFNFSLNSAENSKYLVKGIRDEETEDVSSKHKDNSNLT